MEEIHKFSEYELEELSYRVLQQIAKSMSLPSNVKKMYLVQLIYAKTHKTELEVAEIVQRVRHERQMSTLKGIKKKGKKKLRLQAMEVSSSNTCMSPPIDLTPKRAYSPEIRPVIKYRPCSDSPKNTSDRVLRSYNIKSYKRPNYSLINNSVLEFVKATERARSPKEKETEINIVSHSGVFYPRVNVTARCVVRKLRPVSSPREFISRLNNNTNSSFTATQTQTTSKALIPARRVRTLSGITPLPTPFPSPLPPQSPQPPRQYEYVKSIGFRRTDGRITKINALVQKPAPKIVCSIDLDPVESVETYKNVEVTIQDIINSNIDAQTFTNPNVSEYTLTESNMANFHVPLTDVMPQKIIQSTNEVNSFSVYYHKKIRAEQVRTKKALPPLLPVSTSCSVAHNMANEQQLPKISDVFSQLNDVSDVTRVNYRQDDTGNVTNYPILHSNTMLEGLYNIKSETLSQPLMQVTTTTGTRCVYSTPTITTAAQQDPAYCTEPPTYQAANEPASYAPYSGTSDEVAKICEFSTFGEQDMTLRRYHEAFRESVSSMESQEEVNDLHKEESTATIPEMVEDALEIISQDGDYMERIGMDVRMQCILCSWAGSKIILEFHIRKEHASQITQQDKDEWNITYKLGSLVNQETWLSHVCERDGTIYVVSVKYEDPDCLMASLTTLTTMAEPDPKMGTLTIYNKVSGEPFSWHGQITELHSNMPYENDPNCLRIELSKLELLPNSANIKLHNRSLVLNSPSKVIVGQPALNDIHIIIFVKLHELEFEL